MAFIEKQRHGNLFYYYLVKNVRISPLVIKKVRIFLGSKVPPHDELQKLFRELEKKAPTTYSAKWIPKELLERVEDIRVSVTAYHDCPDQVLPEDFLVRFTYNTNAIEGNPLTLRQTALILSDKISPQGATTDNVVEVMNGKDAWEFVKKYKAPFTEKFIRSVQYEVTKNTKCRLQGKYRDSEVRIGGSEWVPPLAKDVPVQVKAMLRDSGKLRRKFYPLELAAWLHNKIVQIHPFTDGNGRTARLIMNWVLMRKRFPPLIIDVRNKEEYYQMIELADKGEHKPFAVFLAKQMLEQYAVLEKEGKNGKNA